MIQTVGLPETARDATVTGGGLVMIGGVLMQVALARSSDVLGMTSVGALIVGVAVLAAGSLLSRYRGDAAEKSHDRVATLVILAAGMVCCVLGAFLEISPSLRGIGFVFVGAGLVAVTLCDHLARDGYRELNDGTRQGISEMTGVSDEELVRATFLAALYGLDRLASSREAGTVCASEVDAGLVASADDEALAARLHQELTAGPGLGDPIRFAKLREVWDLPHDPAAALDELGHAHRDELADKGIGEHEVRAAVLTGLSVTPSVMQWIVSLSGNRVNESAGGGRQSP